jgi:hypothetical protein
MRREESSATDSGPMNSSVTASPSPIVSIAMYSDRFMTAKISASASTGYHCWRVNAEYRGRTVASSAMPATHWRIATTPAGPRTPKASAAVAAPSWFDTALPVISATPAISSRLALVAGATSLCSWLVCAVMASSMNPLGAYAKCMDRVSYTILLWISS